MGKSLGTKIWTAYLFNHQLFEIINWVSIRQLPFSSQQTREPSEETNVLFKMSVPVYNMLKIRIFTHNTSSASCPNLCFLSIYTIHLLWNKFSGPWLLFCCCCCCCLCVGFICLILFCFVFSLYGDCLKGHGLRHVNATWKCEEKFCTPGKLVWMLHWEHQIQN